jgi:hypothetical protein
MHRSRNRTRLGIVILLIALCSGCNRTVRPASVPGSVPATPYPRYRNVAPEAGIRFRWGNAGRSPLSNLETFGCGCAFLDANQDGWLDILLVGEPTCALFLNRGDGSFEDASERSGLSRVRGPWKGCAVGDVDGDGYLDLLLTGYNALKLLRGAPGPRFQDVTQASGLRPRGWGSSAGFMDLDGDGRLDLVVGNYVVTGPGIDWYCEIVPGVRSGCPPHHYSPQFARLWRNNGDGTFADVSAAAGMKDTHGKVLALGFADYDSDGRPDFYLANDGTPGDLMHNLGSRNGAPRFENVGVAQGVALGVYNQAQAAMGVDWADYDGDGRLDLVTTAFSDEPYSLYHNLGSFFENVSTRVGIAGPTAKPLGFGAKFVDVDNDGWPDLVFANGHVYDNVRQIDARSTYRQPMQLFRNHQGQSFEDASARAGADFAFPIVGRGLATGDYDQDGRVDLLVVDYEGEPRLLRDEAPHSGHWLELELAARGPNRFAYGARVTLRAGGRVWVQEVTPASSYLSSSSPWLHFGLGALTRVDEIRVRWPDGRVDIVGCDSVNRKGLILEGMDRVRWREPLRSAAGAANPRRSGNPSTIARRYH